jgi:hypothetical protein
MNSEIPIRARLEEEEHLKSFQKGRLTDDIGVIGVPICAEQGSARAAAADDFGAEAAAVLQGARGLGDREKRQSPAGFPRFAIPPFRGKGTAERGSGAERDLRGSLSTYLVEMEPRNFAGVVFALAAGLPGGTLARIPARSRAESPPGSSFGRAA